MVIPALSALIAVRNLKKAFLISVIFGLIATLLGLHLSFLLDLPSGPTIVTVLCILLALSWLSKKDSFFI
ncbi:MAG: metal ABC transporter permease [bacterium]